MVRILKFQLKIELLIVLIIFIVLCYIMIPKFLQSQETWLIHQRQKEVQLLLDALMQYEIDHYPVPWGYVMKGRSLNDLSKRDTCNFTIPSEHFDRIGIKSPSYHLTLNRNYSAGLIPGVSEHVIWAIMAPVPKPYGNGEIIGVPSFNFAVESIDDFTISPIRVFHISNGLSSRGNVTVWGMHTIPHSVH
jgi:type II secretory pathway pseudopilin PulG